MSYVHNAESYNAISVIIASSSYSTVKCSSSDTSTFMDVQFIKHTATGRPLLASHTFPEKVVEHEIVNSQFQLDDLQDIKATIHSTQSCWEIEITD